MRALVRATAVAAGVGAALAAAAPTGTSALDVVYRALMAAAVVLVGVRAKPWAFVIGGGVAIASTYSLIGTGCAVLALAAGATAMLSPEPRRLSNELVVAAFALSQAVFHLGERGGARTTTGVALAIVSLVFITAARRVRLKQRHGVVAVGLLAIAVPLVTAVWRHERSLVSRATLSVTSGIDAARSGDTDAARRNLSDASASFRSLHRDLTSWWTTPARLVPGLAQQLRAARSLAAAGADLSATATGLATKVDPSTVKIESGRIDLKALAALEAPLTSAVSSLEAAQSRTVTSRSIWLVPQMRGVFDDFVNETDRAIREAKRALLAVQIAPDMLGANGPRRYFLALETTAEMRGTGGLVGNYGVLTAENGAISLSRFGRIDELNPAFRHAAPLKITAPADYVARYRDSFSMDQHFQNVTASPDFPSVGQVIAELAPQVGLGHIDGAIAIDPVALAGLLGATGPVTVPEWPDPLTADNAAEILLYRQYVDFGDAANAQRVEFLASTSHAVFERLTSGAVTGLTTLADALGPAINQKRLVIYSTNPANQAVLDEAGVAGGLAPIVSDYFGLVTQDATPSKLDWFLRRDSKYTASVDLSTGETSANAKITLRNTAPAAGLPKLAYGTSFWGLKPAESRMYVSVYSPLVLDDALVNGQPLTMEAASERDRFVYSTFVVIPPGGMARIELKLSGTVDTSAGYQILFGSQPGVVPDRVSLELSRLGAKTPAIAEHFELSGDTSRTLK